MVAKMQKAFFVIFSCNFHFLYNGKVRKWIYSEILRHWEVQKPNFYLLSSYFRAKKASYHKSSIKPPWGLIYFKRI